LFDSPIFGKKFKISIKCKSEIKMGFNSFRWIERLIGKHKNRENRKKLKDIWLIKIWRILRFIYNRIINKCEWARDKLLNVFDLDLKKL
jgi:hypothetical protein